MKEFLATRQTLLSKSNFFLIKTVLIGWNYGSRSYGETDMYNEMPVFDYEDIQLIPNKCIISSRSEADTQVTLGDYTFKLPVIPANMQTIIDENIAEDLAKNGYFYIMHRFDEEARKPFVERMHEQGLIASISVGVKDYEYDFVTSLKDDAPEFITIDIAHGHSDSVINMIQHIKKELPKTFVIAGNVGTPEAVRELENAGADATKSWYWSRESLYY